MARRPPMKIAASPSETPEHDAVRERERSSEAIQAKMREQLAKEEIAEPKEDSSAKRRSSPKAKKAAALLKPKRARQLAEVLVAKPDPGVTKPVHAKRMEQRISVGVPISLATLNALEKVARKLGTDVDYIKRALIPKSRAAFLERASVGGLNKTSNRMSLLFEQRIDNGVALVQVKLAIDADIEVKVRAYIPDPLDVISVNRLVAAFVGAEFEILVSAL